MNDLIQTLARELDAAPEHVENVVRLIDEGATIPFIARYRKELHGSMDDQLLRRLADRLQYLRGLAARKEEVRAAVEGQGKLTEDLSAALDAAATLAEVEDLYRPYGRPGRGQGACGGSGAGRTGLCGPGKGGGDGGGRTPGGQRHPG